MEQWIEGTLRLAAHLREGRERFTGDREFGRWLVDEDIDVGGRNDQAALLAMGAHPEEFRNVLISQTETLRPNTIWIKVKDKFSVLSNNLKAQPSTSSTTQTDPIAVDEPPASVSVPAESHVEPPRQQYPIVAGTTGAPAKDLEKAKIVQLIGISVDEYKAVLSAHPPNRQRAIKSEFAKLAKTKKKVAAQLWHIAVDLVAQGRSPRLSNQYEFSSAILMPETPPGFVKFVTLAQAAERIDRIGMINERAMEMRKSGAEIADIHAEIVHIWEHKSLRPPKIAAIALSPDDSKHQITGVVKFCGETIWPNEALKSVEFRELDAAWHLTWYWARHLATATPQKPKEVLHQLMHLMRDIEKCGAPLDGFLTAMGTCIAAYARKNNGRETADMSDCIGPSPV